MKKKAVIFLLAALLATTGCSKTESPPENSQKKFTAQMEELQRKIEKLEESYTRKLDEMQTKFDEQMARAREEYNESMAALKEKKDKANQELAELKSAPGATWEKARTKMEKTAEDLQRAYERARSRFK
jgi:DNA repair exonuclease SbcCD ATPase subunit